MYEYKGFGSQGDEMLFFCCNVYYLFVNIIVHVCIYASVNNRVGNSSSNNKLSFMTDAVYTPLHKVKWLP